MTPAAEVLSQIEIPSAGGDRAEAIGPGVIGAIYRSLKGCNWYRILTREEATIQIRQAFASLAGSAQQAGLAPITAAEQSYGGGFFYVTYSVDGGVAFLDASKKMDPMSRARTAAAVCSSLASWREAITPGFAFSTAEIVLQRGVTPLLLAPLPSASIPSVTSLLAWPARVLALAPELLRGQRSTAVAVENYALGATLLELFWESAEASAEELLLRAANGTVFDSARRASRLPVWLARVQASTKILSHVMSLVESDPAARSTHSPEAMAGEIQALSNRLAPLQAIEDLRGTPAEALALAQDILLEQENYEVMVLAGRIAGQDLNRWAEAIDYFEHAIRARPNNKEAYGLQLSAIAKLAEKRRSQLVAFETGEDLGASLFDGRAKRDFYALPPQEQTQQVETVSRLLLRLKRCTSATQFIWPHIMDGQRYLWWKFPLVLDYIEAKICEGQDNQAAPMLADTKQRLAFVRENKTMDMNELQQYGARLMRLERVLVERKQA